MKGIHGTCDSYAQKIKLTGFKQSKIGLAGCGIYFWACDDEELTEYVEALAVAWWKFQEKNNKYSDCKDASCSLIKVRLSVHDGLFIDLEAHELKGRMIVAVNEIYLRLYKRNHKRFAISKAYDLFVKMLEDELQNKADIVRVAVRTPQGFDATTSPIDFGITGLPICYIVKNKECIEILSCKKYEA